MENEARRPAPRLCIIADDLTGALDAAAPFAGRGLKTAVAFDRGAVADALASHADIIAVTTGSREIAPDDAASRVAEVHAALPAETPVFKKVDSRMKGHVAAELAALGVPGRFLVAPAIPDFGRIVRDGAVTGFGVAEPVAIAPRLGALAGRAIIPDIAGSDDLDAALAAHPDALPVGARGLAEALAVSLTGLRAPRVPQMEDGRMLIVVGSQDPITTAQVEALKADGRVAWFGAPNGILPAPETAGSAPVSVVQALPGAVALSGAEVADNLAESLCAVLARDIGILVLTGGATAEAVLARMGIRSALLDGECLPGLPLARAGGLTVVTKSGGFGDADTLVTLAGLIGKGVN
ncbi:four-carbon acid sugar kinase family protein [Rhizobiaceae bacterium BDR2-2]|uniref:Four-carbon acid sugar kinase family protein n=1 Tax=Ectorhizobium quercum TaxID=2965071 RepID=A0AAE3N064_9HYPH|nr:four-carbon acid sugar kinase family protein [Ectorhizobium quercum]MCX8998179.1 four-carbon acid sugar kinase family protein [Ectorhizobium quercum]